MSDLTERAETTNNPEDERFLRGLGERVRDLRARRGMTRRILARDSGVSERYLAQLELGRGNISVLRLREVARAMGLPLEDLLHVGPEQSSDLALMIQQLQRLSPARLAKARQLLATSLEAQGRQGRIALIGLRGAGKTTLGNLLAKRLNVPFIELADVIEREAGMTLSEVFSLSGQSAYRRYERRALQSVVEGNRRFVVAPGGSIVSELATFDDLLSTCFTIWLKASPEEHMARVIAQGDQRPMNDNREAMKDMERILAGRSPMYAKADASVDTAGRTIDESLSDLLNLVPQ